MLPEAGHVNASLKMAKSLKANGHRIFYLGISDFEDYIISQGLEFVPIMADHFPKGFLAQNSFNIATFEVLVTMLSKKLAGSNVTAFDVLRQEVNLHIQRIRPDLVVSDALLADFAFIIHSMGVPIIFLSTTLFYPWDTDRIVTSPLRNVITMFLCPQEFDFHSAKKRDCDHYVEASIDVERIETDFPFDRLDKTKRLIYFSLGSQTHLFSECKQFLQTMVDIMWEKQDCEMILTTGRMVTSQELRSIPPNVFTVQTAPQLQILRRASLMVTHGGLNSVKECIYFGVPMIVFPLVRDQPLNAARIVYHGLGLRGDIHKINAGELLEMINRADGDPDLRERVGIMAKRFRELEESPPSIRIIEEVLNTARMAYGMSTNKTSNRSSIESAEPKIRDMLSN